MKSSKLQAPSSREISSLKSVEWVRRSAPAAWDGNENVRVHDDGAHGVTLSTFTATFGAWKFGASLKIGCWCLVLCLCCLRAQGQAAIDWHGMVGGGGLGAAVGNYQLISTIGQPVASNPTPDGSLDPNDHASLASGFLSVAVVDTFSMLALISSVNPSGFKDSVMFTASLPAGITGSLVFKTNNVALSTVPVLGAATSVSTALLPRQDNTVAAEYSGDFYHIASTNSLTQTVTNHPPASTTLFLGTPQNTPLVLPASMITVYDYDRDGDPLTMMSVNSPSTVNGAVTLETNLLGAQIVTYTPPLNYSSANLVPDQFSYVVNDGFGGSTVCYVAVVVQPALAQSTAISQQTGGSVALSTYGLGGYTYGLQYCTELNNPNWQPLATVTAAANGYVTYTDTPPANAPARYYRFVYPAQ